MNQTNLLKSKDLAVQIASVVNALCAVPKFGIRVSKIAKSQWWNHHQNTKGINISNGFVLVDDDDNNHVDRELAVKLVEKCNEDELAEPLSHLHPMFLDVLIAFFCFHSEKYHDYVQICQKIQSVNPQFPKNLCNRNIDSIRDWIMCRFALC